MPHNCECHLHAGKRMCRACEELFIKLQPEEVHGCYCEDDNTCNDHRLESTKRSMRRRMESEFFNFAAVVEDHQQKTAELAREFEDRTRARKLPHVAAIAEELRRKLA